MFSSILDLARGCSQKAVNEAVGICEHSPGHQKVFGHQVVQKHAQEDGEHGLGGQQDYK